MKRYLLILLLTVSYCADAQVFYRRSEFGACVGGANYFGDLNTNYGFQYFRYSGGVFYKYNFTHDRAVRLCGNYPHVGYRDKYSGNYYQQQRNLDFKSNLFEFGVMADFNFFQYTIGDYDHRFTPYVTLGASMFYYDPYSTLDN